MKVFNRRSILRSGLYGAAAGVAAFGYGSLIERRSLAVERIQCPILNPQFKHLQNLKIAVLADFHFDDFGDAPLLNHAIEQLNREEVEIAILAGDFISKDPRAMNPLCDLLSGIRANLGTYSVYGNHDRWYGDNKIEPALKRVGVKHLVNQSVQLPNLSICGLDSMWGGKPSIKETFKTVPANQPIIVAWHEPDTFDLYQDPRVILQVSGHTHGGQVCAPIKGELILPLWGRKYARGLFTNKDSHLYVNRGIGVTGLPTRFLSRPELTIIELV